jgi:hypothetical protein
VAFSQRAVFERTPQEICNSLTDNDFRSTIAHFFELAQCVL